jgi:hypothetical protein
LVGGGGPSPGRCRGAHSGAVSRAGASGHWRGRSATTGDTGDRQDQGFLQGLRRSIGNDLGAVQRGARNQDPYAPAIHAQGGGLRPALKRRHTLLTATAPHVKDSSEDHVQIHGMRTSRSFGRREQRGKDGPPAAAAVRGGGFGDISGHQRTSPTSLLSLLPYLIAPSALPTSPRRCLLLLFSMLAVDTSPDREPLQKRGQKAARFSAGDEWPPTLTCAPLLFYTAPVLSRTFPTEHTARSGKQSVAG